MSIHRLGCASLTYGLQYESKFIVDVGVQDNQIHFTQYKKSSASTVGQNVLMLMHFFPEGNHDTK